MKILRLVVNGVPFFRDEIILDFFATQRAMAEKKESLRNVTANVYTQNVLSLVGMNAAGKTTTLKIISVALQMLDGKPLNSVQCKEFSESFFSQQGTELHIQAYFVNEGKHFYKIETSIKSDRASVFRISEEKIWRKPMKSVQNKSALLLFSDKHLYKTRTFDEEYLLDDVSLVTGINKGDDIVYSLVDSINLRNMNASYFLGNLPKEIVSFLDPNIEKLTCRYVQSKKSHEFEVKFQNSESLFLNSVEELEFYLSSGTVKGLNVFISAMMVLQKGGYLIIDEIENHFHKEIVHTLIQLFQDSTSNPNGATIVFSTHYPEILDFVERVDSIFVVRNRGGIMVENFSTLQKRDGCNISLSLQAEIAEAHMVLEKSKVQITTQLTELIQTQLTFL